MAWQDDQWRVFCMLVEQGWHGDFSEPERRAWRILLEDFEPDAVLTALKLAVAEGRDHRPSVSVIVGLIRKDPSLPTFEEMVRLVYGRRGVMSATPDTSYFSYEDLARARLDRAKTMHPLVASFVLRIGLRRLGTLPLGDPKYGEANRLDLKRSWETHVETFDERTAAQLAAGTSQQGLQQLDPLAVLGLDHHRPQLEAGEAS